MNLNAIPVSNVLLDGRPMGQTPRMGVSVPPGSHTVVFVNSGQGQRVAAGLTTYAASKFALRALADGLRQEEPSLRVTTVYPGSTATDMLRARLGFQGTPYVAEDYLRPSTVAGVIAQVLATPPDGVVPEVTVRPRSGV